jgi:hypothetical protein
VACLFHLQRRKTTKKRSCCVRWATVGPVESGQQLLYKEANNHQRALSISSALLGYCGRRETTGGCTSTQ